MTSPKRDWPPRNLLVCNLRQLAVQRQIWLVAPCVLTRSGSAVEQALISLKMLVQRLITHQCVCSVLRMCCAVQTLIFSYVHTYRPSTEYICSVRSYVLYSGRTMAFAGGPWSLFQRAGNRSSAFRLDELEFLFFR